MNAEKFLPLGSVVLLKDAKKRLMIIGYYIKPDEEEKIYDYAGCLYPEGMISSSVNCLFNHNQIEKIFCLGFSDDEEKKYRNELKKYLNSESK